MPITIDFSEVPTMEPVPEAEYLGECVSAKEGVSSAGNTKIDLQWKILEGEYEGRYLFDNMTFTANSAWRAKRTLIAMGFDEDFSGEIEVEDLVGRVAQLYVVIEPARDDPDTGEHYDARNRVKKVMPAGDIDFESLV